MEKQWSIEDAREIVRTSTYREINGMILDLWTASAMVAVYDALSPANKANAETLPLTKFAAFAIKHTS